MQEENNHGCFSLIEKSVFLGITARLHKACQVKQNKDPISGTDKEGIWG